MKRSIFILFALCIFSAPLLTHAQVGLTSGDIDVSIYPENPGPNQKVDAVLSSSLVDINSSKITWTVDGKMIQSERGLKNFTFTTGDMGKTSVLGVTVQTVDGQVVETSLRVKPTSIDLLWQSESYVPPFYKGKALFSYSNKITFIAIPHLIGGSGSEVSPKSLVYKWSKNGTPVDDESGYGKNTFTISPGVISRPMTISVEVSTIDATVSGFAQTSVSPGNPFVLFYRKDPVYGIEFQKALSGDVALGAEKEMSVLAVPFFFGTPGPYQWLSYRWQINGKAIDNDVTETTRVFRPSEGTSGSSKIGVSIENRNKILQLSSASFDLSFTNDSASDTSI